MKDMNKPLNQILCVEDNLGNLVASPNQSIIENPTKVLFRYDSRCYPSSEFEDIQGYPHEYLKEWGIQSPKFLGNGCYL